MNTGPKFFKTSINSEAKEFSIQTSIPTIDGIAEPMELILVIEDEETSLIQVMNFSKLQAVELLEELKRVVYDIQV